MAADFHFYEDTFANLSTTLSGYVGDTASSIISAITPVATTMLIIYVMLWGWMMMRGMINEPITDGVTRIVRLAVITGIALNLGRYNTYVSDWLWNSPDAIAGVISGSGSTGSSGAQYLDSLMGKIYDLGNAFWQKGVATGVVMPDIGLMIVAILIWAAGIIATGYGAFLLCLSKMGLAIMLAVGPIFILLTIFEATKRFLDTWMGQVLNYIFMVMLSAAALKMIFAILEKYLNAPGTTAAMADPSITQALPCLVLCLIGALVLVQVPSMASALGGGVAMSTLGAAGWAYGKTKGTMSAMRPTNLKRSMNRARSDVRIAKDAGRQVAGAPLAVYRKITGGRKNRIAAG